MFPIAGQFGLMDVLTGIATGTGSSTADKTNSPSPMSSLAEVSSFSDLLQTSSGDGSPAESLVTFLSPANGMTTQAVSDLPAERGGGIDLSSPQESPNKSDPTEVVGIEQSRGSGKGKGRKALQAAGRATLAKSNRLALDLMIPQTGFETGIATLGPRAPQGLTPRPELFPKMGSESISKANTDREGISSRIELNVNPRPSSVSSTTGILAGDTRSVAAKAAGQQTKAEPDLDSSVPSRPRLAFDNSNDALNLDKRNSRWLPAITGEAGPVTLEAGSKGLMEATGSDRTEADEVRNEPHSTKVTTVTLGTRSVAVGVDSGHEAHRPATENARFELDAVGAGAMAAGASSETLDELSSIGSRHLADRIDGDELRGGRVEAVDSSVLENGFDDLASLSATRLRLEERNDFDLAPKSAPRLEGEAHRIEAASLEAHRVPYRTIASSRRAGIGPEGFTDGSPDSKLATLDDGFEVELPSEAWQSDSAVSVHSSRVVEGARHRAVASNDSAGVRLAASATDPRKQVGVSESMTSTNFAGQVQSTNTELGFVPRALARPKAIETEKGLAKSEQTSFGAESINFWGEQAIEAPEIGFVETPQANSVGLRTLESQDIARQIVSAADADKGWVLMEIQPPELGKLEILVSRDANGFSAQIVAHDRATGEALSQQRAELMEAMGQQGLELRDLQIRSESGSDFSGERSGFQADDRPAHEREGRSGASQARLENAEASPPPANWFEKQPPTTRVNIVV